MELLTNNKPFSIYLSYEVNEIREQLKNTILTKLKNVTLTTFELKKDLLVDSEVENADLIITDLCSNIDRVKKIHDILERVHFKTSTPFLFIIDDETMREDLIQPFQDSKLIYDFIKHPFFDLIFINRIRVLLSIPKILKYETAEKKLIQENLWNVLNYSNIFSIVVDKNLNIKLINYHLSHVLGYDNQEELIGKSWRKFLRFPDLSLVEHAAEEVLKGNEIYKEFTNDIITKDGKIITVKWFNSLINNGFDSIFSLGVSLTKEPTLDEDIDSIRSYFTDILQKDKTTINAMKEIANKNSEKILGLKI